MVNYFIWFWMLYIIYKRTRTINNQWADNLKLTEWLMIATQNWIFDLKILWLHYNIITVHILFINQKVHFCWRDLNSITWSTSVNLHMYYIYLRILYILYLYTGPKWVTIYSCGQTHWINTESNAELTDVLAVIELTDVLAVIELKFLRQKQTFLFLKQYVHICDVIIEPKTSYDKKTQFCVAIKTQSVWSCLLTDCCGTASLTWNQFDYNIWVITHVIIILSLWKWDLKPESFTFNFSHGCSYINK